MGRLWDFLCLVGMASASIPSWGDTNAYVSGTYLLMPLPRAKAKAEEVVVLWKFWAAICTFLLHSSASTRSSLEEVLCCMYLQ